MMGPTIKKELLLLKRDPRVLVRLIAMPVLFIALFGMAFNGADKDASQKHPLLVFRDRAAAAPAEQIEKRIGEAFAVSTASSKAAVDKAVGDGAFDVGLVFGPDFDPAHGKPALIVVDPDTAQQVKSPLIGAIRTIAQQTYVGGPPPPEVAKEVPPAGKDAPKVSSAFQLTVPGNAVLFGFFIALTCALGFAEERRSGTWRRLLASPVPAWQLLVAKLVPYVALGFVQVSLLFVIGALGFGMQIGGSIPALVVLTLGVSSCATALGLAIASFSTTEKQISSLGSVLILIMGLVGGCMFPRMLMPHLMQQIGLFVPHGWALDGYYTLLVHQGAGFADVIKPIGAVYGFTALFALIGVRRFRFDGT